MGEQLDNELRIISQSILSTEIKELTRILGFKGFIQSLFILSNANNFKITRVKFLNTFNGLFGSTKQTFIRIKPVLIENDLIIINQISLKKRTYIEYELTKKGKLLSKKLLEIVAICKKN